MSGVEETDIEEWKTFLRYNSAKIILRLKISDRLITLLYSHKIIDEEDMEKLESISSTAKQQMEMVKMWGNVPEKIPTLIAILKRDEFLLEPVASILEGFGKPKPRPIQRGYSAQPFSSDLKSATPGIQGERPELMETRRNVTIDDTQLVSTDVLDGSVPELNAPSSRQAGGIAGNDLSASSGIISQTTRGRASLNRIGGNIGNPMFSNQVRTQLSFMNNMAANLNQQLM